MHLTSNCNSYDHLVFFRTNWLLMLSYFIDHYKHKQNVIIGGSNASNRSSTSLTTTFHSSISTCISELFLPYLGYIFVISFRVAPSEKGFSEGTLRKSYENFVFRAEKSPHAERKRPGLRFFRVSYRPMPNGLSWSKLRSNEHVFEILRNYNATRT